jgi:large subunit ribosomal protein L24
MAAKIKKGDRVIVLAGKDKGRQGQVIKVMPKEDRLVVAGVNMVKRHTRPSQADPQGRIEDGKKVRVAKKSGEVIDG